MKIAVSDLIEALNLSKDKHIKLNVNINSTKQYHAIRKIQKKYEMSLNVAKSLGDDRQYELEKQLKVATECLEAIVNC